MIRFVFVIQTGLSVSVWVLTAADMVLRHGDQPEDSNNVPGREDHQQ